MGRVIIQWVKLPGRVPEGSDFGTWRKIGEEEKMGDGRGARGGGGSGRRKEPREARVQSY